MGPILHDCGCYQVSGAFDGTVGNAQFHTSLFKYKLANRQYVRHTVGTCKKSILSGGNLSIQRNFRIALFKLRSTNAHSSHIPFPIER